MTSSSLDTLETQRARLLAQLKEVERAMERHPDTLKRRLPAAPIQGLGAALVDSGRLTALHQRLISHDGGGEWSLSFTLDGRHHHFAGSHYDDADWVEELPPAAGANVKEYCRHEWAVDDQLEALRAVLAAHQGAAAPYDTAWAALRIDALAARYHPQFAQDPHLFDAHTLATLLFYVTWDYEGQALDEYERRMLPQQGRGEDEATLSDLFASNASIGADEMEV